MQFDMLENMAINKGIIKILHNRRLNSFKVLITITAEQEKGSQVSCITVVRDERKEGETNQT